MTTGKGGSIVVRTAPWSLDAGGYPSCLESTGTHHHCPSRTHLRTPHSADCFPHSAVEWSLHPNVADPGFLAAWSKLCCLTVPPQESPLGGRTHSWDHGQCLANAPHRRVRDTTGTESPPCRTTATTRTPEERAPVLTNLPRSTHKLPRQRVPQGQQTGFKCRIPATRHVGRFQEFHSPREQSTGWRQQPLGLKSRPES